MSKKVFIALLAVESICALVNAFIGNAFGLATSFVGATFCTACLMIL